MKDHRFIGFDRGIGYDVYVTVLKNRKEYLRYCNQRVPNGYNASDSIAMFLGRLKKQVRKGSEQGNLVFNGEDFTDELIAHECSHAIVHAFRLQNKRLEKNEEAFATLLGYLVSEVILSSEKLV